MKYNKKAEIYTVESTPNGYGGYIKTEVLFATVDASITPIHYDLLSGEDIGNRVLYTCKLFTKTIIPNRVDYVVVDGVKYNVLNHADLGKIQLLELEKVDM